MREIVLFVCEGTQHLAAAIELAKVLKKTNIECSLFYAHAYPDEPECKVFKNILNDIMIVPGYLQYVGLTVFFTNESSPYCMSSTRIGFIAKRTGTPTITMQHGWIQPGLNFQTNLSRIGFLGRGTDSSLGLWHFSPILTYFGEDGIGYPLGKANTLLEIPKKENTNILVSTNLNWNVYSRENIVNFLRALMHLKQEFPLLNLLHRPHPAENPEAIAAEIGMYMESIGVTTSTWPSISSAIDWADIVISTPSTVILDAYFKGTPTFVYKFDGFEKALEIAQGISFSNGRELSSLISRLLTNGEYSDPQFAALNSSKLETAIKSLLGTAKNFKLDEEDYLQYRAFCRS